MTARLYYTDGLPQANVARLMGVSQPQVSRILSLARECNIVQITVAEFDPRDRRLEERLVSALSLRSAIVIKTTDGLSAQDLRQMVGHFAAPCMADLITRSSSVAIAGGRILSAAVRSLMAPRRHSGLTVVQAPADFARLSRSGAVGEICGRYFDEQGNECATLSRDRVVSIELNELRRIPDVVAVVTGVDRVSALLAAIRGGLIKSLIIDKAGASALESVALNSVFVPTDNRSGISTRSKEQKQS